MEGIEGLGSFYLGKPYDTEAKAVGDGYVLYDSKDLTTHAVCVGMTGSGKTGLCVGVIEEAALDGVPSIVIDPKGDLADLMLTFPALRPEDFRPWINEDDAAKAGVSPDDFAKSQSELWSKGLADWGQDGARIQRLRDAADFAIYTPGSDAGLPVSVLGSFAPPADRSDAEAVGDQIGAIATGLLALLGIDADPIKSREHILLSSILGAAWGNGQALDIPSLIAQIQQPPFAKIGVLDLDSFYPQKERFELALALNNLLAAPGFQLWMQGVPLDVGRLLRSDAGKPQGGDLLDRAPLRRRAHVLRDAAPERRAGLDARPVGHHQPARARLHGRDLRLLPARRRAALEEAAADAAQAGARVRRRRAAGDPEPRRSRLQGPLERRHVADRPPADRPGQAARARRPRGRVRSGGPRPRRAREAHLRARQPGLPAQQRPRERARGVPDALDALVPARPALAAADRHAHGSAQVRAAAPPAAAPRCRRRACAPRRRSGRARTASAAATPPALPSGVQPTYLPLRGAAPAGATLAYAPMLLGAARVRLLDTKNQVDEAIENARLAAFADGPVAIDWANATDVAVPVADLETAPRDGAAFREVPAPAREAKGYARWSKDYADWLYQTQTVTLLRSPSQKIVSRTGESEADFRSRLAQGSREGRDKKAEALRAKYEAKVAALQQKLHTAEQAVDREENQERGAGLSAAVSVAGSILGGFLGRKSPSVGSMTGAARGAGRVLQQRDDVKRAEENVKRCRASWPSSRRRSRRTRRASAPTVPPPRSSPRS